MAEFSQQQIHSMREDAIRRAREMHRRFTPPEEISEPAESEISEKDAPAPPLQNITSPISGLLSALGDDKDTWLLLGVALLLYEERAATSTILAVLYLLF